MELISYYCSTSPATHNASLKQLQVISGLERACIDSSQLCLFHFRLQDKMPSTMYNVTTCRCR